MVLRVTIAGAGRRGGQWAREVAQAPAWQLAAVAEPDGRQRAEAPDRLGVAPEQTFASLEQALESSRCDAVILCTPPATRWELCELAASQGIGLLIEKPLALDLSTAVGLVSMTAAKGVPLVVGQNYRYTRAQRTVRRLVSSGALGTVRLVTCQYYRTASNMQPWLAGIEHAALWELSVHHLDALRHTLGREFVGVMAQSSQGTDGAPTAGATVQVLLEFEGGIHGIYGTSYESVGGECFEQGQQFYERVVGDRATLHVLQRWLVLCERGRVPRVIRRGRRPVTEEGLLLKQLERSLLAGDEPESSGRDNLHTIATLEACARSASERRWVNPQELLASSA